MSIDRYLKAARLVSSPRALVNDTLSENRAGDHAGSLSVQ